MIDPIMIYVHNFDTWHIELKFYYQILILQTFDPPDKLREKISVLCDFIRSSQHMVVHTGAGVSTAAGMYINTCMYKKLGDANLFHYV